MNEKQRKELLRIAGSGVRFDCPMQEHTTFRVGGKVEALCPLKEFAAVERLLSYVMAEEIPYIVVGKGSNLLVQDAGLDGVVLLLKGEMEAVEKDRENEKEILAGGGTPIAALLSFCTHAGLGGLEFLAGIPGTAGGAVVMNAGAWGRVISDRVSSADLFVPGAGYQTIDRTGLVFSYRNLRIPEGAIVARVRLRLTREAPERMRERIGKYLKERKTKQPIELPSAGSVFKNPPGKHAGKLIEMAGLKGMQIGGGMISPKHANFIVNTGRATAQDILALMHLAREKVRDLTGIELEPEIKIVGRPKTRVKG